MKVKVLKVRIVRSGEADIELVIPMSGSFASVQLLEELLASYVDDEEVGFSFTAKTAEL